MGKRRQEHSGWLDSTDPDLSEFYKHGGKIIMTIGAIDNIASFRSPNGLCQSLIDEMDRKKLDKFARMYVVRMAITCYRGGVMLKRKRGIHGGQIPGKPQCRAKYGSADRLVENGRAPAKTLVIDQKGNIGTNTQVGGYLLCSYPNYQKYTGGPADSAASYESAAPNQ
jgi:feruloyl esterase